jgi:predicted CoA-binding protein
MSEARQVLAGSHRIVIVDWPSRDVPGALATAGFTVFVKGGPGPADFTAWEISGGQVTTRPLGGPPERADLVYAHRPLAELPSVISLARSLGAAAVWRQSGLAGPGERAPAGCWLPPGESAAGRELAAAAGLAYVDDAYIADVARGLRDE